MKKCMSTGPPEVILSKEFRGEEPVTRVRFYWVGFSQPQSLMVRV
jgi:hypothetical protein